LIAVIEIVSPGNKGSANAIKAFARKTVRDPEGIHPVIWQPFRDEPFVLPADKPLTLASYSVGEEKAVYVEPVAVGDALPDMPLFLSPERYAPCPLDAAYRATWAVFPVALRGPLTA